MLSIQDPRTRFAHMCGLRADCYLHARSGAQHPRGAHAVISLSLSPSVCVSQEWRVSRNYASPSWACISRSSFSRSITIFTEKVAPTITRVRVRRPSLLILSRPAPTYTRIGRMRALRLLIYRASYTGTVSSVFTRLCRKWQHVIRASSWNPVTDTLYPVPAPPDAVRQTDENLPFILIK